MRVIHEIRFRCFGSDTSTIRHKGSSRSFCLAVFVRGRRKKIVESVRVLPDFRLLSRGSVFRTVKAGDVFGEIIHRALCSSEVRGRVGLSDPCLLYTSPSPRDA